MFKKSLVFLGVLGLVVGLLHLFHAMTLDQIIHYQRIRITAPNFPQELDGYTVAFTTDTHAISDDSLHRIATHLNTKENIQLLLNGGDFSRREDILLSHIDILADVDAPDGIFVIRGNHDRVAQLREVTEPYDNITFLHNSGVQIADGFFLGGVDDLWYATPSIPDAIVDAQPNAFILLLAHNPDPSMLFDTSDIDLMLSGHTHGGQVRVFGLYAPYLSLNRISQYGQRFMGGFTTSPDGALVYTSRGTGQYWPRVFVRPEVTILQFFQGNTLAYHMSPDILSVGFTIFILWNVVVFGIYATDKIKAISGDYRIPEKTLLWLLVTGGGFGAVVGIFGIRHKINKPKFTVLSITALMVYFTIAYALFVAR